MIRWLPARWHKKPPASWPEPIVTAAHTQLRRFTRRNVDLFGQEWLERDLHLEMISSLPATELGVDNPDRWTFQWELTDPAEPRPFETRDPVYGDPADVLTLTVTFKLT